jgi:branched-chain amino acid transport system permease protein
MVDFAHRRAEIAVLVLIMLGVLFVPFAGSRLAVYSLTITALYAAVVISLNLLLGLAGQASFAQTTFMAIGGYGSALLTTRLGLDPWLALILAAIGAYLAAYLIGRPLLRLRGHYLSMATFALALGTYAFANAATELTNGTIGISGVLPLGIGGFTFDTPLSFYILSWVFCGLVLITGLLLANSHFGRAWRALSTNTDIAAALGVDVPRYLRLVLVISAVIASIAGSLYVEFTSFVGPDLYDINIIITLFLMLFVGGRGSTVGPIVGAGFLVIVPQLISGLERFQNLVFFSALLVLILVRPSGLFGPTHESIPLRALLPRLPSLSGIRSEERRRTRGAGRQ